jgi:hypothetical protein
MHQDTKNLARQIRDHMEVVGSDGARIGVVDRVEGERLKLTRDASPTGEHRFLPLALVSRVDDRVHLSTPGNEPEKAASTG